jgi:tetratricopeptide (TPR) repeat protein
VWYLKRKFNQAITAYQEAIDLNLDHPQAYEQLAKILICQGRIQEALNYYEKALFLAPETTDLSFYYRYLGIPKNANNQLNLSTKILPDNPLGKINLYHQKIFPSHRSGWGFAINALQSLHNHQGVWLDGFIENNFAWNHRQKTLKPPLLLRRMEQDGLTHHLDNSEEKGITPYNQAWVGIIHNPQSMPTWFHYEFSPQSILAKEIWQKSLKYCQGLFTLSEYHAEWLREQTGKPVSSLIHPTEIPEMQFDFTKFLDNPQKKIVQIGWWLRRLNAIYQLPLTRNNPLNYEKLRLTPFFSRDEITMVKSFLKKEQEIYQFQIPDEFLENTKVINHLPPLEYDILLSGNIAFLDLYDASSNS